MFGQLPKDPNYPEMERSILQFWDESRIFDKLREKNRQGEPYSFIDGPLTANNPMGVHHAWGRTYKDLFQRYHAMKGHKLRYQNGFDCQGLWVEVEVEKELGFRSKHDIEDYGIDQFVEKCKERVLKYSAIQTQQSIRLGMWMDWPNSYFTMSDENNYTIWHFLKRCHEHGWITKGHDVMPWCPRCGTTISDMEIATEGYRELTHTSLYVLFPLLSQENTSLLVWTTTPWTLPANVAAAVHPDLTYVKVRQDDRFLILAETCLSRCFSEPPTIVKTMTGKDLSGLVYETPFSHLDAQRNIEHRVLLWKDVSADEGTGIVHIAPGCGKEDFALGREHHLPIIAPLNEEGIFGEEFGPLTGKFAGDLAPDVIGALKKKTLLFKSQKIRHRYPVCWRCGSELLFRLVNEWFIGMDELRHKIMQVVPEANWVPSFCEDREMDWLRNMGDWCISKKRYWGLALPIFECSCGRFEVIGSEVELRARAVEGWQEFDGHSPHRPWIDAVKIRCESCGNLVSRIPDVGNPWLDAGIVPFSTLNYRDDKEHWSQWFPADFITESFPGQFRNWFYSLLTMSTVLEGRAPFKNLLGYASVHDENGEEMHKSKGNAIWFDDAADKMGADIMRWMFASQNVANNLLFGWSAGREARRKLMTLWNVAAFFATYADLDRPDLEIDRTSSLSDMDRWILSLTHSLVRDVTQSLERYDSQTVTRRMEEYLDHLSKWYVRRCRRRFWKSSRDEDKAAAYWTLYQALDLFLRLLAPILPFTAESIYQSAVRPGRTANPESVQLCNWPASDASLIDSEIEKQMDVVLVITRMVLSARKQAGVKVRQPLARFVVVSPDPAISASILRFEMVLKDELNVKEISFTEALDSASIGQHEIVEEGSLTVALDTAISLELLQEGIARDFVRHVQTLRKESGFDVQDRITLMIGAPPAIREALERHRAYIQEETLALGMELLPLSEGEKTNFHLGGEMVSLVLQRI